MLNKLRKINENTAVYLALVFYAIAFIIQVMVITEIVPYNLVNGGRSESYATQLPISIVNIVVYAAGAAYIFFVYKHKNLKHKKLISGILWFLVALWTIGFVQQLLGTPFEKLFISWMLLVGIISHLRLAIK